MIDDDDDDDDADDDDADDFWRMKTVIDDNCAGCDDCDGAMSEGNQ